MPGRSLLALARACVPQFGRLADQKMNVLRHHHVSVDEKAKVELHALEGILKDLSAGVGREQGRR